MFNTLCSKHLVQEKVCRQIHLSNDPIVKHKNVILYVKRIRKKIQKESTVQTFQGGRDGTWEIEDFSFVPIFCGDFLLDCARPGGLFDEGSCEFENMKIYKGSESFLATCGTTRYLIWNIWIMKIIIFLSLFEWEINIWVVRFSSYHKESMWSSEGWRFHITVYVSVTFVDNSELYKHDK